jgi:hypothetical protein
MASSQSRSNSGTEQAGKISGPQRLLDDITLLLVAGIVVPTLIYLVLGVMSLLSVPPLPR